jgi:hypothetical protein
LLFCDGWDVLRVTKIRVLKLKNPRTSVGAGAFDLAEFLSQPATAPGLISPRLTTTETRPKSAPTTTTELLEAAAGFMTEAGAAVIDRRNLLLRAKLVKCVFVLCSGHSLLSGQNRFENLVEPVSGRLRSIARI